jgi:hypothetical protein
MENWQVYETKMLFIKDDFKNDGLWLEIESQINWNSNLITDNFKYHFKLNIYKSII